MGSKKKNAPAPAPPPPPPKIEDTTQAEADTKKRARGSASRQSSIRNVGGAAGLFGSSESKAPSLFGMKSKLGG